MEADQLFQAGAFASMVYALGGVAFAVLLVSTLAAGKAVSMLKTRRTTAHS